jgi:hypothetical protein
MFEMQLSRKGVKFKFQSIARVGHFQPFLFSQLVKKSKLNLTLYVFPEGALVSLPEKKRQMYILNASQILHASGSKIFTILLSEYVFDTLPGSLIDVTVVVDVLPQSTMRLPDERANR